MQQSSIGIHILIVFDGNTILMLQVRASVIQMLPSAEISDLPVVVKFILQSVSDNDAFEVWYTNSCAVNFSSFSTLDDLHSLSPQCLCLVHTGD